MAEYLTVLDKDDLPPGEVTCVEVKGRSLAIFNIGGSFYAIDNRCKHRGGPLGEGVLVDQVVSCPWHGWKFNVTTGESPSSPDVKVHRYALNVEGSAVQIILDDQD